MPSYQLRTFYKERS